MTDTTIPAFDRRCPWCGGDTLARDGADERCTSRECLYRAQGKVRP